MAPTASIIVPTRERAGYLDVALGSIAPQARSAGAEVIVVDDGPDEATRETAVRHGARYVVNAGPHGLNPARNAGIAAAGADLLVFVDDDVEAAAGWLDALLAAPDACGVLTGPIRARFEDHALRACGREGPPITFLDLGDADTDSDRAWGANMAIRRRELERLGPFDPGWSTGAGDEEEWVRRYRDAGGRIRYLARAAVVHRRAGDDARLGALARAAFRRGATARRYDAARGTAPSATVEARVLAGCVVHAGRFACENGLVLGAHAAGRLREALAPASGTGPASEEDFLSGTSGTVGGRRGALRRIADRALDALEAPRRAALRHAARSGPRLRVLVLGAHRDRAVELQAELGRSRHELEIDVRPAGGAGKFENLNAALGDHDLTAFDWLVVVDDDVALPRGFLDGLLFLADRFDLVLAQPAQSLASHAAWPIARRRPFAVARETTFVEIGPVTAFRRDAFAALLPFPPLRMAWGLDLHWAAVAREHGWRLGIVDAVAVRHERGAVAAAYPRADAVAEARAFLARHAYIRRDEVRDVAVHRRW